MNASAHGTGLSREHLPSEEWRPPTFQENLDDWMQHTPWLLVSLAAHVLAFLILAAIPWQELREPPRHEFFADVVPPPKPEFDDPDEPDPVPAPVDPPDDPDLQQFPIDVPVQDVSDRPSDEPAESPFDANPFASETFAPAIGLLGAPPGGPKYGGRGADGPGGRQGRATSASLRNGLAWLAAHQSPDGFWDADGFDAECGDLGATRCSGAGYPEHDVGVTSLALLAFLGAGNSTLRGEHSHAVRRGVHWLTSQQDPDTGLVGARTSREFLYDHALATLALCESYLLSGRSPLQKRNAQRAVDYVVGAQNPYSGWRYDVPPAGPSDTSVTGWMVFALTAARDAGLDAPRSALDGALAWIAEVTDSATGRVGYQHAGSRSSRIRGVNDHFPAETGEAMTAVGLLSRVFIEKDELDERLAEKQAELLLRATPAWDPDGGTCDMYYWYYGTYAMFQIGAQRPDYWKRWESALVPALLDSQRIDGDALGSWDPTGPWGHSGGRVYSTALMTLCLEVHFRYGKLLGGR